MLPVSKYVLEFINLTVPGFIYLSATFILLMALTDNKPFKLIKKRGYLLYVSIFIVVFSYLTGFLMHLAEQRIIHTIFPHYLDEFLSLKKTYDAEGMTEIYVVLIMIRHLIVSTLFLAISLIIWFNKNNKKKYKVFTIHFFIVVIAVLSLAYLNERSVINRWKKQIKNKQEQTDTIQSHLTSHTSPPQYSGNNKI